MAKDQVVTVLNHLIETNTDVGKTLQVAAAKVRNLDVKQLLRSYARERTLFAMELQVEVQRLGGQAQQGGTMTGTLHRGWVNLKELVTGNDECAVLAECERGECTAVAAYEDAARRRLPAAVKKLLARQMAQVRDARDRIRSLEAVLAVA